MKIAVDAMGGDYAPAVVVEGALSAARELNIPIILVGDRARIEAELAKHKGANHNISIVHASEVVAMDESPTQAIRKKKDSSLRVCFDLVKNGAADAVVSAGNSGAAMAAGIFLLKKIKGVERPAIAVSVPTMKEPAVILDVGGNVDCKPSHLFQFAIMGEVYARYVLGEKRPRVGLLSNGEEEGKGNEAYWIERIGGGDGSQHSPHEGEISTLLGGVALSSIFDLHLVLNKRKPRGRSGTK